MPHQTKVTLINGRSKPSKHTSSQQKPCTAFLEIQDYNTLTPNQQTDALDFILDDEQKGLSSINGYGFKIFDVFLGDYGLPHQQWHVHIIMVNSEWNGTTA